VKCQTRTSEAAAGAEIAIDAGVRSEIRDCGCAVGTAIEVRNLFHNTPVRRTFLKADATEAAHVGEAFTRLAIAHPGIHFVFRSGGRVVHELVPSAGMRERIATFFGQELADSLMWVENRLDGSTVTGYVAHPSQSRSSNKYQYLFLHGRAVRDRSLQHALAEAYRGLIMVGRYPVAFLHLDLPPEEVDVNVHPAKIEVRFRNAQQVYSQVLATIRKTFLGSDLHARLQPSREKTAETAAPNGGVAPDAATAVAEATPKLADTALGDLEDGFELAARRERQAVAAWFDTPASGARSSGQGAPMVPPPPRPPEPPVWAGSLPPASPVVAQATFDEFAATASPRVNRPPDDRAAAPSMANRAALKPPDGPLRAIQIHDSYLVIETPDGLEVVDQHALHERILFEELRARIAEGSLESQRLLIPETVDLTPAETAALGEQGETLRRLGFEVEPFGGSTVLVNAVPAMLGGARPERLVRDLAEHLTASAVTPTPDAMLQDLLATMACKAAIKAGDPLTPQEITALLARRDAASTHHCPHGRPSSLSWSKSELERQFGRT
jgi:DNA mismatch repair protein MutL